MGSVGNWIGGAVGGSFGLSGGPVGTAAGAFLGAKAGGDLGGFLGGISGFTPDKESKAYGINLNPASDLSNSAYAGMGSDYAALRKMVDAGAGESDVAAGYGAQKDLAAMLKSYQDGGGQATQADIDTANRYGKQLFAGQQEGLNQSFEQARQGYAQQAAVQGRNPLDAVFANKQYTGQQNAQSLLNARQGAFSTDYAMHQPLQRLDFATQRANIMGGLATQAMANRQALMAAGSGILGGERKFQIDTSSGWGTKETGGGWGGVRDTLLAGGGAAAKIYAGMPSGGGGGSSGSSGGGYGLGNYGQGSSSSPQSFFGVGNGY